MQLTIYIFAAIGFICVGFSVFVIGAAWLSMRMMRDEAYGKAEAEREGFPQMDGKQFVEMFCEHMRPVNGCVTEVTRIEFEYVD